MNPSPYFLINDISIITRAPRRGIIIETSSTQFLPNQTNSLIKMLNRPFYYEVKVEISNILLGKISKSHIRGKKLKLITILLVWNPSLDDDFDKLCSPEHTAASYRGQFYSYRIHHSMMISTKCAARNIPRRPTKDELKIKSREIPQSNLYYTHNTLELHGANQYKWFVYGSDKVKFSITMKHTFSTFLFFREMSKQTVPIPMEVEEEVRFSSFRLYLLHPPIPYPNS